MDTTDAAMLIVTCGAATVTAVAAFYSAWQAKTAHAAHVQARELYVDQNQPYVFADLRSDEHQPTLAVLYVRNQGPTVAHEIHLTFDPPLATASRHLEPELAELTIPALPPGSSLALYVGVGHRIVGMNQNACTISINGKGRHGPMDPLVYPLQLPNKTLVGHKTLSDVANAVERIAENLENAKDR